MDAAQLQKMCLGQGTTAQPGGNPAGFSQEKETLSKDISKIPAGCGKEQGTCLVHPAGCHGQSTRCNPRIRLRSSA